MYSQEYDEDFLQKHFNKNKGQDKRFVDPDLNAEYIKLRKEVIEKFDKDKKVRFYHTIMEFEAWLLRLRGSLQKIGIDAKDVPQNPEEIYKPAKHLKKIYPTYDKKQSDIESICSNIAPEDIMEVLQDKNESSFKTFLTDSHSCLKDYILS